MNPLTRHKRITPCGSCVSLNISRLSEIPSPDKQELDDQGNPTGPVKSDLAYQAVDENGNPTGEVKTDITYDVID